MRHARQLDVADIEPAPLHQPLEVRPRHRLADIGVRPVERGKRFGICLYVMSWHASGARPRRGLDRVDDGLVAGAAAVIAGKMLANLLSIRLGDCFSRSCAAISMPGVQKPHCSALRSRNAACRSAISPLSDNPSIVSTDASCVCTASIRQERTISPLTRTVHAPHTPCSQPTCVPVSLQMLAQKIRQIEARQYMRFDTLTIDLERNRHRSRHADAPAWRSGRSSSADTQRASSTFARCRRMAADAC